MFWEILTNFTNFVKLLADQIQRNVLYHALLLRVENYLGKGAEVLTKIFEMGYGVVQNEMRLYNFEN